MGFRDTKGHIVYRGEFMVQRWGRLIHGNCHFGLVKIMAFLGATLIRDRCILKTYLSTLPVPSVKEFDVVYVLLGLFAVFRYSGLFGPTGFPV